MNTLTANDIDFLKKKAKQLRRMILDMLHLAGSGHPGGSLSAVEILTLLYYRELRVDSSSPECPDRDRFILSKGHACPLLYAILADKGFFPQSELKTFRQFHSILQGHPDKNKVPGVEISSGSLGMGISFGIGTSLGARMNGKAYHSYVLTGCGELNEGQNWEAFMSAAKYGLDTLTVIIDYNKVQLDGTNDEIMPLGNLAAKIRAFDWNVVECDGHDFASIEEALEHTRKHPGRPGAVIAHTVKGKGISFMEGKSEWHGKTVDDTAYEKAMKELEE